MERAFAVAQVAGVGEAPDGVDVVVFGESFEEFGGGR